MQVVTQILCRSNEAARIIVDCPHCVVPIGPQYVSFGYVIIALYGIAVDAAEQKVVPIEPEFFMKAFWRHMFHRQIRRKTPLTIAAVAPQSTCQVINGITVIGIGARCGAPVNRPHFDLSVLRARASSFRMALSPGFAE